jgi:hypothetical protein
VSIFGVRCQAIAHRQSNGVAVNHVRRGKVRTDFLQRYQGVVAAIEFRYQGDEFVSSVTASGVGCADGI